MSLKRTELLCLRVSDGLGRNRDFEELDRRGIDSKGWSDIGKHLATALKPKDSPPNLLDRIMETILSQQIEQEENLYGHALLPDSQPDITAAVLDALNIGYEQVADTLSPTTTPDINELVLRQLDIDSGKPDIREALSSESTPDITSKIMNAISSITEDSINIGSALKPDEIPDLSDAIFSKIEALPPRVSVVEEQIVDEKTLNRQTEEMGFDLGDCLRSKHQFDLWARIQESLDISSTVVVETDDDGSNLSLIDDNQNTNSASEPVSTVNDAVVIEFPGNNLSGELDYPVDESDEVETPQSSSYAMMGVGLIFAVAAGLLMMFQFGGSVESPIAPGEEVFSVAAVNELQVESLEVGDDVMVQIFQSEENAPTIIFIDDSLIVGDEE